MFFQNPLHFIIYKFNFFSLLKKDNVLSLQSKKEGCNYKTKIFSSFNPLGW